MTDNLLIIMSDEHQARAMGCAGHPFVQTPNLDRLAAQGTRFTRAYTPSPICVPARAAFASGQYVHQNRLWDNAMPYTGAPRGWGHVLQDHRIPVESIGKLHYRHHEDPAGFDVEHIPMQVVDGVGMVWASIRKEEERISPKSRMLGDYIGPGHSKYTEYDQSVVDRTRAWFKDRANRNDPRPWCLFVGLVAPHFPLVVPQEYYDLYPLETLPEPKLHPKTGYRHHPWIAKLNALMPTEDKFLDPDERLRAMAAYYGLCSWLDRNVGEILQALAHHGFGGDTTVVYTSDHGDNVGARGLWGKSNMYEESAAVPLILSGSGIAEGRTCDTPVSLLDLSASIPAHFGLDWPNPGPGQCLKRIADQPTRSDRVILSEYHAAGAVTGAFMLVKGSWKLVHYVGFDPELFDLERDPEELENMANDPACATKLEELYRELHRICDPEAIDTLAHHDQAALIDRHGGRNAALKLGAPGATPPPRISP